MSSALFEGKLLPCIDYRSCDNCKACTALCPHGVLREVRGAIEVANPLSCKACYICQANCPTGSITFHLLP